jgi:5-methylcytosine-specific restriction endonuclease McrA
MPNVRNLAGLVFGKLTVTMRDGINYRGEATWKCLCECGEKTTIKSGNLVLGKTKSCGCINTGPQTTDITGKKFFRLTAIRKIGRDSYRGSLWEVRCDCGAIKKVLYSALIKGTTLSCGCYNKDHKKSLLGNLNPNYNSEKTEEERVYGRHIVDYKSWVTAVKERDAYKCQVCGASQKLVSHHLHSYATNPSLRREVSNGVCLCVSDHRRFHREFGYRNNTPEQFEKYKESRNGN